MDIPSNHKKIKSKQMKNIFLTLIILAVFNSLTIAQNVGINTTGTAPDNSAMLDIDATNRGVLIPRVSLSATNVAAPITTPATSLMVYNTATAGTAPNNVTPGYYYWNGTVWVRVELPMGIIGDYLAMQEQILLPIF